MQCESRRLLYRQQAFSIPRSTAEERVLQEELRNYRLYFVQIARKRQTDKELSPSPDHILLAKHMIWKQARASALALRPGPRYSTVFGSRMSAAKLRFARRCRADGLGRRWSWASWTRKEMQMVVHGSVVDTPLYCLPILSINSRFRHRYVVLIRRKSHKVSQHLAPRERRRSRLLVTQKEGVRPKQLAYFPY